MGSTILYPLSASNFVSAVEYIPRTSTLKTAFLAHRRGIPKNGYIFHPRSTIEALFESGVLQPRRPIEHKVLLLDSTLREGEQSPGVSFTVDEKLEIARKLDEVGLDMIEAGDPNVSNDVYDAVKKIAAERLDAEVLAHCRAVVGDIDRARSCDVQRIAIFLATSKTHLQDKLRKSEEEAVNLAVKAIEYAREHGMKVRFTAEDASRTDYSFLAKICKAAETAGADRISIPDTVGIMDPDAMRALFGKVSKDIGAELDAHCHNDLGLATANALAALEGGATAVHVTVNGIGERSGITRLSEVAVALKVLHGIDTVKLDELPSLSLLVEKYTGIPVAPNSPVVGDYAFAHKSGVHTAAVLANPTTYEPYAPDLVGKQREIVIDKYTGRHAVKAKLERLGISLSDEQVQSLVQTIKDKPMIRFYRDADLVELAERMTGLSLAASIPTQVEALMLIKCESNIYTTAVARKVLAIRNVASVYEISGDFDVEARVVANSIAELNDALERIRGIRGVQSTNTRFIFKKFETESLGGKSREN